MMAHIFPILMVLSLSFSDGTILEEAISLYKHGKFDLAADQLARMSDSSPEDPNLRLWLGKSLLKMRRWNEAVRELDKAVQLEPSDALYHLWLGRACGDRASHTIFFKALGWARRVVREFEIAQKLSPGDAEIRFDLLDFYLNAPGAVGGGRDKAEAEALAIARLDPEQGYMARAMILKKDEKWDLAREELIQATIGFPKQADTYKDVADFLLLRQDFAGAASYAQEALSLDSRSVQARMILAAAETQLRRNLADVEKILRELAAGPLSDDNPTFEEVYYWLGRCYVAQGKAEKAREAFEAALAFNPDYGKAKNALSQPR